MALVSKKIINHVESELRAYPQKIKIVNEQRDEIILGSHFPEVSVSGGELSNTTQSKGMRLAAREDMGWPELIEKAMRGMPRDYKMIIELRYFRGYPIEVVADRMYVSRTQYYVWRDNIIYHLLLKATKEGIIDPFA